MMAASLPIRGAIPPANTNESTTLHNRGLAGYADDPNHVRTKFKSDMFCRTDILQSQYFCAPVSGQDHVVPTNKDHALAANNYLLGIKGNDCGIAAQSCRKVSCNVRSSIRVCNDVRSLSLPV